MSISRSELEKMKDSALHCTLVGDYNEAITTYRNIITLCPKDDHRMRADCCLEIAYLYRKQHLNKQALEYENIAISHQRQILESALQSDDVSSQEQAMQDLAVTLYSSCCIYKDMHDLINALKVANESTKLYAKIYSSSVADRYNDSVRTEKELIDAIKTRDEKLAAAEQRSDWLLNHERAKEIQKKQQNMQKEIEDLKAEVAQLRATVASFDKSRLSTSSFTVLNSPRSSLG